MDIQAGGINAGASGDAILAADPAVIAVKQALPITEQQQQQQQLQQLTAANVGASSTPGSSPEQLRQAHVEFTIRNLAAEEYFNRKLAYTKIQQLSPLTTTANSSLNVSGADSSGVSFSSLSALGITPKSSGSKFRRTSPFTSLINKGVSVESAGHTGGGDAPYLGKVNAAVATVGQALNMRSLDTTLNEIIANMSQVQNAEELRKQTNMLMRSPQAQMQLPDYGGIYSRKVFVGGLPPDIDEELISLSFNRFGPLIVDWPHKAASKSVFPPKGYAFLLFQDEQSVQKLISECFIEEDKLYVLVSSPSLKNKPVQVRPWRLADSDYILDNSLPLDPRKTVFVGGVPRPLKAIELGMIMDRMYGGVSYAGIDIDPEYKYPKGAGRVSFSNEQSYIATISARFIQLQLGDIDKRVEVKPYVLDDQLCDECRGVRCNARFAPYFCANVACLKYYCDHCWAVVHSLPGREYHKPLVKEGADRPRTVPYRWNN